MRYTKLTNFKTFFLFLKTYNKQYLSIEIGFNQFIYLALRFKNNLLLKFERNH